MKQIYNTTRSTDMTKTDASRLRELFSDVDENTEFTVYFPTQLYSDRAGDYRLPKAVFDKLLSRCLERYKKYTKSSTVIYSFADQQFTIMNRRETGVQQTKRSEIQNMEKYVVVKNCVKSVSENEFRIIDKYHDICKQNKMIFKTPVCVLDLVTESYEDIDCNYFVTLSFNNDSLKQDNFVEELLMVVKNTVTDLS